MIESASPLLPQIAFWLLATVMIGCALGIVFHRSIVYSALMMLMAFLSIAGIFALLNAPFLAAAQVLVYGVGLTIVMIFGIMLTGDKPFIDQVGAQRPAKYWQWPLGVSVMAAGLLLVSLMPNLIKPAIPALFGPRQVQQLLVDANLSLPGALAIVDDGGLKHIGVLLFSKYLLAFELASVLLLLAMIGAILLAMRHFPEEASGQGTGQSKSQSPSLAISKNVNQLAASAASVPSVASGAGAGAGAPVNSETGAVKSNV